MTDWLGMMYDIVLLVADSKAILIVEASGLVLIPRVGLLAKALSRGLINLILKIDFVAFK